MEDKVSDEEVAYGLFQDAMRGEWKEVVKAYSSSEISSTAQKAKITKSEETALHIAVQDGQTEVVLKLLDSIGANEYDEILKIANVKGNTPLHLAAALGDVIMCHAIASRIANVKGTRDDTPLDLDLDTRKNKLVSVPNKAGETPLFLAALNGNQEAFLCLHSHCEKECYSARAKNGDTILHVAIFGQYFSLAFQIILWHPELVDSMNQDGFSPLHILASTPTAFKSNSRLQPCNRFIYQCFMVEKLKVEKVPEACPYNKKEDKTSAYQVFTKTLENKLCCCLNIRAKGENKNKNAGDAENPQQRTSSEQGTSQLAWEQGRENHPNYMYTSLLKIFKFMEEAFLMIDHCLPIGISNVKKTYEEKKRHTHASQIMDKLVEETSSYMYLQNPEETRRRGKEDKEDLLEFGGLPNPINMPQEQGKGHDRNDPGLGPAQKHQAQATQTPILIAAKMGVTEMVKKILDKFPVAIRDVDSDNKNIVLLAVENRQPHVYNLLVERKNIQNNLFRQVDNQGNNALHLAAKYGNHKPWLTPGAALQMQWELKWYMFVKKSMPPCFTVRENIYHQTPKQIFTDTHTNLQEKGNDWMVKTSESCSVVAALIATVAFATSATVPGGLNDSTGQPILRERPAFNAFTISSLLALCLSVTALVFFLSILTSRYEVHDFSMNLPRKLLLGLTSLFASIVSVLVSFCTGHVFLLDQQMRHVAYPLYAATCFPVTIFAIAQLSLYYDLIRVIFKKIPQRSYKEYQH